MDGWKINVSPLVIWMTKSVKERKKKNIRFFCFTLSAKPTFLSLYFSCSLILIIGQTVMCLFIKYNLIPEFDFIIQTK